MSHFFGTTKMRDRRLTNVVPSRSSNSYSNLVTDDGTATATQAEQTLTITSSGINVSSPSDHTLDFSISTTLEDIQKISFSTTPSVTPDEGDIYWSEDDKTLNIKTETDTVIQVGQEMVLRGVNKTGSTLTNGQLVYVSGAQGNRPTFTLAKADAASTSDTTLGYVTSNIENNQNGYVTTFGLVRDVDTNGLGEGSALYLSASTAGAYTTTAPTPPQHAVSVGVVVTDNATEGVIFARMTIGFESTEMHDVSNTAATTDNDVLLWNTTNKYYSPTVLSFDNLTNKSHTNLNDIGTYTHSQIDTHVDSGIVHFTEASIDHTNIQNVGTLTHSNLDTLSASLYGSIVETIDPTVDASGANTVFTVQGDGATDLTVVTPTGLQTVDTTPALSVNLTDGTSTVPVLNYVFFDSNLTLTANTTGWPAAFHAPLATVLCLDKATTAANGALKVHAYTDHLSNNDGHISHIGKRIRAMNAIWTSGVAITTVPVLSGSGASMSVSVASGSVFQMHPHAYPAFDGAVSGHNVVNDPAGAYTEYTDLASLTVDSNSGSLTNKHYCLIVWGVVSEKTGDCHLMVNLPSGSYNTQAAASRDADQYCDFSIPSQFIGVGFLIARLVVKNTSDTTFTMNEVIDLRGLEPALQAGGGAGITSHSDLTNLTADDHTQYHLTDGTRTATGTHTFTGQIDAQAATAIANSAGTFKIGLSDQQTNIWGNPIQFWTAGGNVVNFSGTTADFQGNITTAGTIDGRDVATDGSNQDTHIGDNTLHFTEGSIDHGSIAGLGDDDHPQYLLTDGSRSATGDLDLSGYQLTAENFVITSGIVNSGLTFQGGALPLHVQRNDTSDGTSSITVANASGDDTWFLSSWKSSEGGYFRIGWGEGPRPPSSVLGGLYIDRDRQVGVNQIPLSRFSVFPTTSDTPGADGINISDSAAGTRQFQLRLDNTNKDLCFDSKFGAGWTNKLRVSRQYGDIAVNNAVGSAQMYVNQTDATRAVPVLTVEQGDLSEPFIHFIGQSSTIIQRSFADVADFSTPGTLTGWIKIEITDEQTTNPITDGEYWIPFYTAPTA